MAAGYEVTRMHPQVLTVSTTVATGYTAVLYGSLEIAAAAKLTIDGTSTVVIL